MEAIKQRKYYWYLGFFIIFGLLIVKIYVSFLFWKKKWQRFGIYYFEINASLYLGLLSNKCCTLQFQNMVSISGHGVMINLINSTGYGKFERYDKFVDKFQDL